MIVNSNHTQSFSHATITSNKDFTDDEIDSDFQLIKSKSNRNLSSTSSIKNSEKMKTKPLFVSTNRFNLLLTHVNENPIEMKDLLKNNLNNINDQTNYTPLPQLIRSTGGVHATTDTAS